MSKGLEELKDLKNAFIGYCRELKCETNYIKVCENKFSKIEKELKALEIIKERSVQISWFTGLLKIHPHYNYVDYNFALADNRKLTKEEYELLKEVLL